MAWAELRGHRMHWVRLPHQPTIAQEGEGLRFVLAHGLFIGNLASWYLSCAHQLSAFGEVLMYDLRGHGKSAHCPDGYELINLADDLDALLEHLGWREGPLHLIGHSYGARVLLSWGLRRPARVAQLTLVDAPLKRSDLPALGLTQLEEIAGDARDLERLIESLPPPLQLALRSGGRRARKALEGWWRLLAESSLPSALSAEPEVLEAQLSPFKDRIRAIYGERSPCLRSAQPLLFTLPSDRLSLIPGAGHYLLNERPSALCEVLISHLREV